MVDVKRVTSGFTLVSAKGFPQIVKTPGIAVESFLSYPNGLANVSKYENDPFLCLQQQTIDGKVRYGFRVPFSRIYELTFNILPLITLGNNPGFSNNWIVSPPCWFYIAPEIYDNSNISVSRDSWAEIIIPGKKEIYLGSYQRDIYGNTRRYFNLFAGDFVTFYIQNVLYEVELNQNYTVYSTDDTIGPILTGSLTEITDL